MADVKKGDFVELKYSGYANGELFDSNEESEIKKLHPEAKVREMIVMIGQGMVVAGLDKALESKEIGKEYEINFGCKEGFGERKKEFVKTIPLKVFREQKIEPQVGMLVTLNNAMAKILVVSGARVIVDFNHPLAGKEIRYRFKIIRKVEDEQTKIKTLLYLVLGFVPEFDISEDKVVVKGPKVMENYVKAMSEKFKELGGKRLEFEESKNNEAGNEKKEVFEEKKTPQ